MAQVTFTPLDPYGNPMYDYSYVWDGNPIPGSANYVNNGGYATYGGTNPYTQHNYPITYTPIDQHGNPTGPSTTYQPGTSKLKPGNTKQLPGGGLAPGQKAKEKTQPPTTGGGKNAIPPPAPPTTGGKKNVIPPPTQGGNQVPGGIDPGQGGGSSTPGGLNDDPLREPTGNADYQDIFWGSNPDALLNSAFTALGGDWNIASPTIQRLQRMAAGLPYVYDLMGGGAPEGFDPFVNNFMGGLFGQGNTFNLADTAGMMQNLLQGNFPNQFAQDFWENAIGEDAGQAVGALQQVLASTLPTSIMPYAVGAAFDLVEQQYADYMREFGNMANDPAAAAYSFLDYIRDSNFGSYFGL